MAGAVLSAVDLGGWMGQPVSPKLGERGMKWRVDGLP